MAPDWRSGKAVGAGGGLGRGQDDDQGGPVAVEEAATAADGAGGGGGSSCDEGDTELIGLGEQPRGIRYEDAGAGPERNSTSA